MTNVTVRYWAAAKQAAGVAEETLDADTLAGAIAAALARRGQDRGCARCSTARRSSWTGRPWAAVAPRRSCCPRRR